MDDLICDFIADANEGADKIESDLARLIQDGPSGETVLRIVRALHKIKGVCGFLKFARVEALAHASEGALLRWRDGRGPIDAPALTQTAMAQIRDILAGVAELGAEPDGDDSALIGALSATHGAHDWATELASIRDRLFARASAAIAPLQRLNAAVAAMEPQARLPLSAAWKSLPPITEALGAALGKPIKLTLEGGETEIPGRAIGPLGEALEHIVRNCADHGIEQPAERRARRKGKYGQIKIAGAHEDAATIITVSDDGRGLDTARIRHRAISHGMVFASHAARMAPEQIHAFIFAPGFSTAETVTTVSGRGIGMDAARAAIEDLGGTISVRSETRQGAVFTLTIPDILAPPRPEQAALEPAVLEPAPIADVA